MTETENIKPCPFCGAKPVWFSGLLIDSTYPVIVHNDGCYFSGASQEPARFAIYWIDKWNRRVECQE